MKKRNIYQNQSQELLHLFEDAGSSEKVMCVPLDYAKKDHLAMFCNVFGDILRKPFSVKNTPEGIAYIDDQVMRSCRRRGIKKKHVFFGGEDANSFAKNFVSTQHNKGFLVANVNAHDAKKQRGNLQASTDRIDLMADYKRRDASGQHADFSMGRRYLRMAINLMRTSQVYLPPNLRKEDPTLQERGGYYLTSWPYLREKWKKVGMLEAAFEHNRPLGLWRQIVQE